MERKPNFFSDSRNVAKLLTSVVLGGATLYGLFLLLPILSAIVWEGINLLIGASVLGILLYISPTIIKNLPVINAKIAKALTMWIIAWDEFIIQEMEIDKARKDAETIRIQSENLFGQVAQKNDELAEATEKLNEARGLLRELISQGKNSDDVELQLYVNEVTRQDDFIKTIAPLRDQIEELAKMCQKVYVASKLKIADAIAELRIQKIRLKSLTSGETAMNKALSIFQEGFAWQENIKENIQFKQLIKIIKEKL